MSSSSDSPAAAPTTASTIAAVVSDGADEDTTGSIQADPVGSSTSQGGGDGTFSQPISAPLPSGPPRQQPQSHSGGYTNPQTYIPPSGQTQGGSGTVSQPISAPVHPGAQQQQSQPAMSGGYTNPQAYIPPPSQMQGGSGTSSQPKSAPLPPRAQRQQQQPQPAMSGGYTNPQGYIPPSDQTQDFAYGTTGTMGGGMGNGYESFEAVFDHGPLGMTVDGNLRVVNVKRDGAAMRQGVRTGDALHKVNFQRAQPEAKSEVIKMIQGAARPLRLEFIRLNPHSDQSQQQSRLNMGARQGASRGPQPGFDMNGRQGMAGAPWIQQNPRMGRVEGAIPLSDMGSSQDPGRFMATDEYQPMGDEEQRLVEPMYEERRDKWVRCRSALRRHEDFSHWLDYVTPEKKRTWPKYEPGVEAGEYEPTCFENAEIEEVPPTERRNKWSHINPGLFFTIPEANTLEVTDTTVVVTTIKPMGKSSANVIMLTDIDRCDLEYKAPANYSFMHFVAWFLNSRIGFVVRSQMLFIAMMILMFVAWVFVASARPGLGTLIMLFAVLVNLALVIVSLFRDKGYWRGKPDHPNETGAPYPTWVRYQHQLGLMYKEKYHPFGFEVREDGTYEVPSEHEDDISVEEYEHYRRGGNGRLNSCGCSVTSTWALLLFIIGLGASVVCLICNKDSIKNLRGTGTSYPSSVPDDDPYYPNDDPYAPGGGGDDDNNDDGWESSIHNRGCLACLATMGGYMFFILVAKGCAFGSLPTFYYNYVPRSRCMLKIKRRGEEIASVDLGDIENAKGAAAYVLYKSEQRRETELKRDIAYTRNFFSNIQEVTDSNE